MTSLIPVYLTGLIILRDMLLVSAGFYIRYISLPKPRTLSRYFDASLATAQLAPTFISKCNTLVQLCLTFGTLGVKVAGLTEQALPVMEAMWWVFNFQVFLNHENFSFFFFVFMELADFIFLKTKAG